MTTSLAVIIPAFNEEKGISTCIEKVNKELAKLKGRKTLLIVNDGSTDNTLNVLKKEKMKYKNTLEIITYQKNKGYGGALATGIKTAIKQGFTYGIIMDSDLTNDPKYIPHFLHKIEEGYDCVKGSRYIKGGGTKGVPFKRRLPSILGNSFFFFCFGLQVHDNTNGFRIVKLKMLKGIPYKEKGFSHILEEMYYLRKKHAKFAELPIILTTRKKGISHFKYTSRVFYDYLKFPLRSLFHI